MTVYCLLLFLLRSGAGHGQLQPVGQLPAVLRADRAGIVAIRGCGQHDGHGAVRVGLDEDLPSGIAGWVEAPHLGLRPAVRRPVLRTAFPAFNGPFRSARLFPGLPGCGDCSHAATKIKVDAEHPARMLAPLPCPVVVTLGKWPEKCRSNAPSLAATTRGR